MIIIDKPIQPLVKINPCRLTDCRPALHENNCRMTMCKPVMSHDLTSDSILKWDYCDIFLEQNASSRTIFSNLPIFLTTKQCNYAVVSICLCHYMYTLVCHCKFLFAKHNRAYLIPILPAVKLSFSLCITVLIQRKQLSSRSMRQTFSIISSLLQD